MTRAAPVDEPLFRRIQENFERAARIEDPGMKSVHWRRLMGEKGSFVGRPELWARFRANVVSQGLDNANVPPSAVDAMQRKCEEIYRRLAAEVPARFRPFLEEVPVGDPLTFEVDGHRVSQASLEYAYMLTRLAPLLPETGTVVEIGGGFGGLARLVKSAFPDLRYVLLDLPEAAAIQAYFLETALPGRRFLYLTEVESQRVLELREPFDFMVLPGSFAARLGDASVDAVINTRSMMEMTLAAVGFYFVHIQRALRPGGVFYCLNRYRKLTRLKDYPFDDRWYAARWSPWPTFVDANPHHEIAAVRAAFPVVHGVREMLRELPPGDGLLARLFGRRPAQGTRGRG